MVQRHISYLQFVTGETVSPTKYQTDRVDSDIEKRQGISPFPLQPLKLTPPYLGLVE